MDRGAWRATMHNAAEPDRTERLSARTHTRATLAAQRQAPPAKAGDAGDMGLILGLGRSLGGGPGNALPCSCLKSPVDRGAWWATQSMGSQSRTRLK